MTMPIIPHHWLLSKLCSNAAVRRQFNWPLLLVVSVLLLLPFGRASEAPVLLAGIIALAGLWQRRFSFNQAQYLVLMLFACYWVPALFSGFNAIAPAKTWSTVLFTLRFLPFALFVKYALQRTGDERHMVQSAAFILLLWLIDAWVQIATGYSVGGAAGQERLSGIFGADNLKLGPVLAMLSPFFLLAARQRYGRVGLGMAFLLLLFPLLLAGSRASWLAYALVCGVMAWRETRRWSRFVPLTIVIFTCMTCGAWLIWSLSHGFDARVQRSLLVFQGTASAVDEAAAGRLSIWRTALRMGEAHPFTGVGVRGFRYAYPEYAASGDHFVDTQKATGAAHAHQILLEVFSETGLFGLAGWVLGVTLALRAWWRASPPSRELAFAPGLALVAMCFPLNTHLAFYSAWWGLLFWWLLALYCAALAVETENPNDT